MPVNPGYPSRVLIVNGHINDGITSLDQSHLHISELSEENILRKIYQLGMEIDASPFMKRMASQIWLNRNQELELSPVLGNYTIYLGGLNGMNDKLDKLETFYRDGAAKAGWVDYRSIDLRYKNQIICSKK